MARRSLTKALSGLGRKSRSDNGDAAAAGTPPPAVQLLPAARVPAASGRAGKPPAPWPSVSDSPKHAAGTPQLAFARNSTSSTASSITFAAPMNTQQRPESAQRNQSPEPSRPLQQSRIPMPNGGSPQQSRPHSPSTPASPTAQQQPQVLDRRRTECLGSDPHTQHQSIGCPGRLTMASPHIRRVPGQS